ncbi:late secretory pathway protein AVL9-like [Strongylocentrotus purpuratus]|uniref:Uncharacterized protein n=1 Tax=Strongylocentrotus purpuratus TaxID=7668 RepID=A0A7M7SYL8_STRPU|nr:late secretory pathway protein AVL9-like [Strongylocentrotus purpuratus]
MSGLHTLLLQPSSLDETFYSTFAQTAPSSKIEKLWVQDMGDISPLASQCLAKVVSSLPCLQTLRLDSNHSNLGEEYSFALTISSLLGKVRISTFILFEIKVTLQAIRTILSLETMRELRMMGVIVGSNDDDDDDDDNDDHDDDNGDDDNNDDGESIDVDVDDDDKDDDGDGGGDEGMSDAGVTQGEECCSTMTALDLEGSLTSKLEVLALDDESIPSVLASGIHTMCPHVQRLHLEFTHEEITQEHVEIIKEFPKTKHLSLKAYIDPLLPAEPPMQVSLDHPLWLCRALEDSTNLRRLSISDITIGDENAGSILRSARRHGQLEHLT